MTVYHGVWLSASGANDVTSTVVIIMMEACNACTQQEAQLSLTKQSLTNGAMLAISVHQRSI